MLVVAAQIKKKKKKIEMELRKATKINLPHLVMVIKKKIQKEQHP